MDQETRWLKRYNEVEGPEKQTANGYGDSGFGCCLLFMGCFDGFDMLKRLQCYNRLNNILYLCNRNGEFGNGCFDS